MNREILFRGKREDYRDWVEGSHVYNFWRKGEHTIHLVDGGSCVVDPSTVGQYTGLTDKNGVKIFEGDICRVGNLTYQVMFQHSQWEFSIVDPLVYCCPYFHSHCGEHCEVIGNIHDNPELIGGEDDG